LNWGSEEKLEKKDRDLFQQLYYTPPPPMEPRTVHTIIHLFQKNYLPYCATFDYAYNEKIDLKIAETIFDHNRTIQHKERQKE
jgi:hypothetical protein